MIRTAIGSMVMVGLLLLTGGAGPASDANDLAVHPEVLSGDFSPTAVTMFGVHVGDSVQAVPPAKILRIGAIRGMMPLEGGNYLHYNDDTHKVTALIIRNSATFLQAGFYDRYDVEFKLGVPDIMDAQHLIYLKKRLLVMVNGPQIVSIEIR